VLVLLLLVVPIAEIAVIIAVGKVIGGWPTLLLLVVESMFGAWLVRREGSRAWRALAEALNSGRMPARPLADAALILVGGTLLLTPGFLTDVVGFFFVLPVTRPLARTLLEAVVSRRLLGSVIVTRGGGTGGRPPTYGPRPATRPSDDVIEGEIVD
jgi:UPF0716 protein FxsA